MLVLPTLGVATSMAHIMTEQDQAKFLQAIGLFIKTEIANALGPIERRLILLEAKGIQYCGAYQRSADYKRGDVVSQSNTMWIAVCDMGSNEIPGISQLWQLADKSQQQQRRPTQTRSSTIAEPRRNT
jgi:hypothetical protein